MAIKEFTIGPQNYFEEGYFDGDYTQPNVSKSFLQCDIDNFKGFRVVTGEYFVDNYIDGTYYHNNTANVFLTCDAMIVTVAEMGLGGYYQDGYFTAGYFTPTTGSAFTLICVTGVDHFGEAAISSSATMTATVGKIIQNASQLVVTVTQVSTISHIEGADIFAFSDAQLTAAVSRIRGNNIAASAAFSVATDASRTRNLSSEDTAVFSAIINGLRSRNVNLNAEAAFSFSASPAGTNSGSAAISSAATLATNAGKSIVAQAALSSQFTVAAEVFDLTERPRQFTQVGTPTFSSAIKKFGTHSYAATANNYVTIPDSTSWSTATWRTIDCWVYIPSSSADSNLRSIFKQGGFSDSAYQAIWISALTPVGQPPRVNQLQFVAKNGSAQVALTHQSNTGIFALDAWTHIRVLNDGSAYHLWIDGSKKTLAFAPGADQPPFTTYISNLNIAAPVEINTSTAGVSGNPMYMDELLITTSTITGSGTSSFSVPTTVWLDINQTDVLLLSHFDGVFNDDQQIIRTGAGAFSSTATLSASAVKQQGALAASTLSSQFTQTATATKTVGTSTAYLYAFFNLSSEVIGSQNAQLETASTLTATARKTVRITKTLSNIVVLSVKLNNTAGSISAFLSSQATVNCTPFKADRNPAPIALDNYRLYHFDSAPSVIDGQFLRTTYFQERGKFGADAILNPTGSDLLGYVPGYYPANGNDWSIDFWHRGRTRNKGFTDFVDIAEIFGGTRRLAFDGNANRYRIRGIIGTGDPAGFMPSFSPAGTYPNLAYNWTHIAIQRKSNVLTLFVNGVSAGSVSDTDGTTAEYSFGVGDVPSGAFDEMRVNTREAYYTGNFTPATSAYTTEAQDYYTVESAYALLEPIVTLTATPIKLVVSSAALSATSTLSAPAVKTARTTKELAVVVTVSASAGKSVDITKTLDLVATITAIATPTRLFASAIATSTEMLTTAQRFRDPTATNAVSTTSLSAVTGFRKQFSADLTSDGGFNIVVVGTRAGVALLESTSTISAVPTITRRITQNIAAVASMTIVAGFQKQAAGDLTSETAFAVTSFIKVPIQGEADLFSDAATTTTFIRSREATSALELITAVDVTAVKRPDAFVTMSLTAALDATAQRFRDPTATNLAVTVTETSSIDRFRQAAGDLSAAAAMTPTATRIKQFSSDLSTAFTVSFLGGRLNEINLVSPSFATILTAPVKTARTSSALQSTVSLTADNVRVRFSQADINSSSTVSVTAVKTARLTQTVSAIVTTTATAGATRRFDNNAFTVTASQSCGAVKIARFGSNPNPVFTLVGELFVTKAIQGEAAFAVTATFSAVSSPRRNTSAALAVTATAVTGIRKITGFTIALSVVSTPSAFFVFYFKGGSASLASQGFVLTAGEVINIDPRLQLIIKPETRRLLITSETRVLQVL